MTTWEHRAASQPHRTVGRWLRLAVTAASCGVLAALAVSAYGVLHSQPLVVGVFPTPVLRAQVRHAPGPLEVAPSVRMAHAGHRGVAATPLAAKYVVSVARLADRRSAEVHAKRLRSKGYLANVIRDGTAYRVVTRPYKNEAAAQKAARVLTEIGFSARVIAVSDAHPMIRDRSSHRWNFA